MDKLLRKTITPLQPKTFEDCLQSLKLTVRKSLDVYVIALGLNVLFVFLFSPGPEVL